MWERADECVEPEVLDEDLEEAADEESVLVDERDEPEPADEEDEEEEVRVVLCDRCRAMDERDAWPCW